ncbi:MULTISPECIES: polysaccharide biosynthesis protein [unclassified Bacillus (in: firmicutes)]|uniref:polysaccharide biosynthesis protein n=1 Tax=unclassified Bacillus (in: firmicutes) TaxID=185979 RepID=UPI00041777AD|nr:MULTISPECIES: nucleoside-diphosphate sugar epimerase/dehydratase [unclassified Bacillus (in: firmicutes)]QHZ45507.1 polysaccharide biosynthesis protein [Bacillus sp. NSP9.1]WFA04688.1 nucleoside-diphosphate sugar epimerase/dehydratase [Bacillus sp. HSf4]
MTYRRRLSIITALDSYLVLLSIFIGYQLILPSYDLYPSEMLLMTSLILLAAQHLFAHCFHLYKKVWEYASIGELYILLKSITLSHLVTIAIELLIFQTVPVRLLCLSWLFQLLLIGGSRMMWRIIREQVNKESKGSARALIIGAGSAGSLIAKQLLQKPELNIKPVAFIDDDKTKYRLEIMGLPVLGGKEQIVEAVRRWNIDRIIIAIPSLSVTQMQEMYKACAQTGVKTQVMPKIDEILLGRHPVGQLRDVRVEDLLGREPVQLDTSEISNTVKDRVVMVTGAGGSIGSEICRQISKFKPKSIVLVGHGENSIHSILLELKEKFGRNVSYHPEIADIQDREKMFLLMERYKPNVIYHAAAHKHVPLMEHCPKEAIKNNILGTRNVAEAADETGVETFVLISSDKAVNPANIMGATKRFAEMLIMNLGKTSKTKFVAVRFGNVLGSRGSVIPIFKKQIAKGGPVTVTHKDMTRYFMTIPEASRLVIQAGALAKGRQIFVLDMGEPVKIVDLAKNLIQLSGYTTDQIKIEFTGIRPGEKMYEELLNQNEVLAEQVFPKIHIGKAVDVEWTVLKAFMEEFMYLPDNELRERLFSAIGQHEKKLVTAH